MYRYDGALYVGMSMFLCIIRRCACVVDDPSVREAVLRRREVQISDVRLATLLGDPGTHVTTQIS